MLSTQIMIMYWSTDHMYHNDTCLCLHNKINYYNKKIKATFLRLQPSSLPRGRIFYCLFLVTLFEVMNH